MFSFIRLIIACVFFVCSIIAIKKHKTIRKHIQYIVVTLISVTLIIVTAFLPFENLFITFDSPKDAYEYYNFGKSNIQLVIEGNNCDFLVDCKSDFETYLIVPKTTDGWKIGIGSNTKRIVQKFSKGITVYVYQYKNTNDYFITILDTNGEKTTVFDDNNTEFFSLEKYNNILGKTFFTYYAHISNLNSGYRIIVNGNEIIL